MDRIGTITRHLTGAQAGTSSTSEFTMSPFAEQVLTKQQIEDYDRDGFIVIRKLFTHEELDVYRTRFQEISSGKVKTNALVMKDVALVKGVMQKKDDPLRPSNVTKLQDFQEDPILFSFCKHEKLIKYVSAFCGGNFRSIHSMLINKPPDLGSGTSRHPMHQDMYYFPLGPTERVVAAWAAMERIDRSNGCLSVIPGSHRLELLPHGYPDWEGGVNYLYHGITSDIDLEKRVFVEMDEGDCVFFHPLLIHGSGKNTSDRFRKAISCHYASGNLTHFMLRPVQNSVVDEGLKMALPKAGMGNLKMTQEMKEQFYFEFWKSKSRQIIGDEPAHWQRNIADIDLKSQYK